MPNKKGKGKHKDPGFIILHECMACGNKWDAVFEVKHCFECGYDERKKDAIRAIKRKKINLIKCSDGEYRIPLKLVSVKKKGKNDGKTSEEKQSDQFEL